ncbi:MAG TPA: glycosyltransferase [Gammaproteobacteria bacterium]
MVTRSPQMTAIDAVAGEEDTGREAFGGSGEHVLYVVSMFPCWSETFIVREIHVLLARGADVRIVSLRRGAEAFVQSDAALLLERVYYPNTWPRSLAILVKRLVMQPVITCRHPLRIIQRLWRSPVVMTKSLVAWFRSIGLLDRIAAFEPDHVHAHWATYASTGAMVIADHTGTPFSFTAHAHDIYLEDQLMDEKLFAASFVATISRFNREYLRRRYRRAKQARIEVVHCGVPRREPVSDVAAQPGNLILSVGRLDEIKGFPVLFKACARLKAQGVAFHCQVVGDGPLRNLLAGDIRRHGLQANVELLGALPSQDVERKLAAASVFVLASQRSRRGNMDGIPVALMEAMASGTPVISTAVSGIPELVEDGRTGLLVPPRDPAALALAIRRMLQDETLRQRCIEGAVRKVRQEFDAETEGRRLLGIIRSIPGELNAQKTADNN